MKGISLPITALIIIIVAVLVLAGVVSIFYGTWRPGSKGMEAETAKNTACQVWVSGNCEADWDDISAGEFGTLKDLCKNEYAAAIEDDCKKVCKCPGSSFL
jgi:hypothetical protein